MNTTPNMPGWQAPTFNLPSITGGVSLPANNLGGTSFGQWFKNYNNKWGGQNYGLLNSAIGAGADIAGNLINSSGLSSTAGNIMSGIGNVVGNIPGPIGWAGKALSLVGAGVNALWGHKFNDANVAAAESANRERNNWQFGDYSNTDALLAGSMANVQLGNVSKGFLGKEGPFSNAVTNKMKQINNDRMQANLRANNSELNAYNNYQTGMVRNAIAGDSMGNVNTAASGGPLNMISGLMTPFGNRYFANGGHTHGGLFNNGFIEVNNGGSHEQNPNQGVQYGVDPQGTPNMVEEGETILDDYVFSKRIKFPKRYKDEFALGGKIWKKSFADVSKMIAKESEERPNDPISQRSLEAMGSKLADIQEEVKAKQALDKMDPREVMAMLQQLAMMQQGGGQPQMQEEQMMADPYQQQMMAEEQPMMAANGGSIYIKPSKRGTFTAAATKHGMGVQEFASQVLANPDNYSSAMVKKANFARNAAKWHACGGKLHEYGGPVNKFAVGGDSFLPWLYRYLISPTEEAVAEAAATGADVPYDYAVNANNQNVTPNYIPVQNKKTWADFKDINGKALYDIKRRKYSKEYLDPAFLEWAWDNPDLEYWNNPANHINWDKDNPTALPSNEVMFGKRGQAKGKGFDKKLGDIHWYLMHLYNKWLGTKDPKVAEKIQETAKAAAAPSTSAENKVPETAVNQDPVKTLAQQQAENKLLRAAREKYKEGPIKYILRSVDENGTPIDKEIKYNADTFATEYPGYKYNKEDDREYDDENKIFTRRFIYTKQPEVKENNRPTWMRYLPSVALAALGFTDSLGITNKLDNSIANQLYASSSDAGRYTPVRSTPLPNPYVWTPQNRNYIFGDINNTEAGAARTAANLYGNNIGALVGNLAAIRANANKARGESYTAINENDMKNFKEIAGLRLGVGQNNAKNSLDAQIANQGAFANALKSRNDAFVKGAEYAYKAKHDRDENISSNMSEFLQSLADIGTENMNWNWRNWAIRSGVFGPMKSMPSSDVWWS